MSYAEACEEAVCYGWVDGIVHTYDEVEIASKIVLLSFHMCIVHIRAEEDVERNLLKQSDPIEIHDCCRSAAFIASRKERIRATGARATGRD
tara:strand:- start:5239 stop:5514 length:276 start_codon:yes stop_codon:yes gene_type:complete